MNKVEKEILLFLEQKKEKLFFIIISIIGCLIRLSGKEYISGDMDTFLLPWYREIKSMGGLRALGSQIGDYSVPYQFFIAWITNVPINAVYLYKLLSCVFDFLLAFFSAKFICLLKKEKSKVLFCIAYSIVLIFPTIVLNSSVWGQCDSIYATFIIIALYFLYGRKYRLSFVFLGIAFSLKLQTIFVIPFFIYYYIQEKKFGISYFLLSLAADYMMHLPGFIMGRSLLEPIKIYLGQTSEYQEMWCNFPSVWALLGNHYDILKGFAVLFTVCILGIGLLYSIDKNIRFISPIIFLGVLIWTVWTCLLFLPSMHERYGYILDILLVYLGFVGGRVYIRYIVAAFLCSLITYGNYLFGLGINIKLLSVIYIIAYINYTYTITEKIQKNNF